MSRMGAWELDFNFYSCKVAFDQRLVFISPDMDENNQYTLGWDTQSHRKNNFLAIGC